MKYIKRITSNTRDYYYHCVTRTVAGEFLFSDREKGVFRSLMQKVAEFCGIEILTYCVMSNHVHILCRVPPADYTKIDDNELLRRYRILFSNPSRYRPYNPDALESLLKTNSPEGNSARTLLLRRMHNISMFMKILKLRMSIWFNQTHNRFGTLWAEKFKSIVVEGRGNPLLRMAQYIDLNPVRAGITTTSAEYPFCGLSDAKREITSARQGIERIVALTQPNLPREEATLWYENHLTVTRHGSAPAEKSQHGPHTPPSAWLNRQKSLSNGLAMGSQAFLNRLMNDYSNAFRPRILREGPPCKSLPDNEPLYFGRKERPKRT